MTDRTDAETVIYRLNEAGKTLLALREKGTKPAGFGSGWPDVVHHVIESYGWQGSTLRPATPNARDIDRMDEAYSWLRHVHEDRAAHRKIVLMRSLVHPINERHLWSWRQIGMAFGWSHTAVSMWHAQAIDWMVAGLNGTTPKTPQKRVFRPAENSA